MLQLLNLIEEAKAKVDAAKQNVEECNAHYQVHQEAVLERRAARGKKIGHLWGTLLVPLLKRLDKAQASLHPDLRCTPSCCLTIAKKDAERRDEPFCPGQEVIKNGPAIFHHTIDIISKEETVAVARKVVEEEWAELQAIDVQVPVNS